MEFHEINQKCMGFNHKIHVNVNYVLISPHRRKTRFSVRSIQLHILKDKLFFSDYSMKYENSLRILKKPK